MILRLFFLACIFAHFLILSLGHFFSVYKNRFLDFLSFIKTMKFSETVSNQRRKQRLAHFSAPSHVKYTIMSSALSEELQKEHGIQSLPIRRDDVVTITRGSNKGTSGKVKNVYRKKWCLYVEKIQ